MKDELAELKMQVTTLTQRLDAANKKLIAAHEETAAANTKFIAACDRLRDVMRNDDGQAWKEGRKFLEKHNRRID